MKKKLPLICWVVSAVLVVAFAIKTIVDYGQYSSEFNSASFSAWILVNALYFIIPAIIVFVVGFVL